MSEHLTGDPGMTVEEWAELDEDDTRELVDGRLEEQEMPGVVHEAVVTFFVVLLQTWLGERGLVFASGVKYALGPRRGRMPDITAFLSRTGLPRSGAVRKPPDVAVEVLSPTSRDHRRDRVEKLSDYAKFGVRYYWLVDPDARTVEILELTAGRYTHVLDAMDGKLDAIPGCDGLVVDLDALWARLDALGPDES